MGAELTEPPARLELLLLLLAWAKSSDKELSALLAPTADEELFLG